jgi:hypothetical protein
VYWLPACCHCCACRVTHATLVFRRELASSGQRGSEVFFDVSLYFLWRLCFRIFFSILLTEPHRASALSVAVTGGSKTTSAGLVYFLNFVLAVIVIFKFDLSFVFSSLFVKTTLAPLLLGQRCPDGAILELRSITGAIKSSASKIRPSARHVRGPLRLRTLSFRQRPDPRKGQCSRLGRDF